MMQNYIVSSNEYMALESCSFLFRGISATITDDEV